ncbi:MAG: pyruvate:ferredoxin (flavodoxin) oxidoreductase [Candidatus Methylacidiphilales bacterium]
MVIFCDKLLSMMQSGPAVLSVLDGNEAVASAAYRFSENIAIYPITPSSPMAEWCDEWSAAGRTNLWGDVPKVVEMQSEAGVAGALHGMLQAGTLATSFTSSQGLLLMLPALYKIAGELTPFVLHVAARSLATHALSIFGDHSDVMSARSTGMMMLCSGSVQEAHDFAAIAHCLTLETRLPILHFFDGFRTSHEINQAQLLTDDDLRALFPEAGRAAHRERALTPDRPRIRGTAQNPDVFFQAREAANRFYLDAPELTAAWFHKFGRLTGRRYRLFEYVGHPEADRVIIAMGSGAEVAHETAHWLVSQGEKVGVLKVRLFRPFSTKDFLGELPSSVRRIAVLDRCKEPGSPGEPLFLDCVAALRDPSGEGRNPGLARADIIRGRYGLSSKEFSPAMVCAIFEELARPRPRPEFTVGIQDDVTRLSLQYDPDVSIEPETVQRAVFYGLGSDGTVGANKNTIKILGEVGGFHCQAYFVYDSKKSGGATISHLRFGPDPIRSSYLIRQAQFVGCHQFELLSRLPVLDLAAPGATFLLNSPYPADVVWNHLPSDVRRAIRDKRLCFYVLDAYRIAEAAKLGRRINTIMQVGYFALSKILPIEVALGRIREAIRKTYARKGEAIVSQNLAAVNQTLEHLVEVEIPSTDPTELSASSLIPETAPDFVQRVTARMLANQGDLLPVSAFPVDGTWPVATSRWEKRNLAPDIPVWDQELCIQCNKCVAVCPHAAIRAKFYPKECLAEAPATFKSTPFRSSTFPGNRYTIQVAPEDCTGCTLCVQVCPAKAKDEPARKALGMRPQAPLRKPERENFQFFLDLPTPDRTRLQLDLKGSQFLEPLFEFSGACTGCGETPYVKLLTQLYGDRLVLANATGCSSIYGGNLPTTPYTVDDEGRGPAWSNSLFEDNAEFGLGLHLGVEHLRARAAFLLRSLAGRLGDDRVAALLGAPQETEADLAAQRDRVAALRAALKSVAEPAAAELSRLADYLVRKTVWILGGDGWAYDIGYGGLDHVLAMGEKVNILVLDTEAYSNTGGQQSKSTPFGAGARFAVAGKEKPKKDLALMAMCYGNIYVARVALGAKDGHTVRAFQEAESYPGTSLVLAYSPCIAHGFNLSAGLEHQKLAVDSGHWPLFRYDPRKGDAGKNPLSIDSEIKDGALIKLIEGETRYRVGRSPEAQTAFLQAADRAVRARYRLYQSLVTLTQEPAAGDASG